MNVIIVGGVIIVAMIAMAVDWTYITAWFKSKFKK